MGARVTHTKQRRTHIRWDLDGRGVFSGIDAYIVDRLPAGGTAKRILSFVRVGVLRDVARNAAVTFTVLLGGVYVGEG